MNKEALIATRAAIAERLALTGEEKRRMFAAPQREPTVDAATATLDGAIAHDKVNRNSAMRDRRDTRPDRTTQERRP